MDTKNNTGYWNTGDGNTGNRNTGYWNTGDGNTGNRNTGYGNTTNRETGIFNTKPGKIRLFNKESNKTFDEIDHPHFSEFYLTKLIGETDMTDEEKKADPDFYVKQGYLKSFSYTEAWANFWKETDENNRQKFLNLPNFDADIFLEITGIDVRIDKEKQSKKEAIFKKIEELKKEADKL